MACYASHGVTIPILSSYDTATREVTAKLRGVSGARGRTHRLLYWLELAWVRRVSPVTRRKGTSGPGW